MENGLEIHQLIEGEIVAHIRSSSKVVCEWKAGDVVALNFFHGESLIFQVALSKHAARHLMAQIYAGLK